MSAQSIRDTLLRQLLVIPPKEYHELAQFMAKEVLGKEGAKEAVLELVERGYPLEAAWRLVAGGTAVAFNESEGTFDLWKERVMQGLLIMEALALMGANPDWPLTPSGKEGPLGGRGGGFLHALLDFLPQVDEESPFYPTYAGVFKEVVQRALDMGMDPDAQDEDGNTPLHNAVFVPAEVAMLLVQRMRNINAQNLAGQTSLHTASDEIQGFLLRHGADPEIRDIRGRTPLLYAMSLGSIPKVYGLLRRGASPDTRDAKGYPALILAQKEEYREKADWTPLLLEWEADANITDSKGRNVLHHLAPLLPREGEAVLWKWALLVKAGANPGLPDRNGITPTEVLLRFLLRTILADAAAKPQEHPLLRRLKGFASFLDGDSVERFMVGLGEGRIAKGAVRRMPLRLLGRLTQELASLLHVHRRQ